MPYALRDIAAAEAPPLRMPLCRPSPQRLFLRHRFHVPPFAAAGGAAATPPRFAWCRAQPECRLRHRHAEACSRRYEVDEGVTFLPCLRAMLAYASGSAEALRSAIALMFFAMPAAVHDKPVLRASYACC